MDEILTLIGNYVFPIAACVALFWKMDKDQKTTQEYMEKRDELHRAIWAIADELRGAVDGWDTATRSTACAPYSKTTRPRSLSCGRQWTRKETEQS